MSEVVLDRELRARIGRLVGAEIESCEGARGGYTPALRLRCRTRRGSFFAKVGTTSSTNEALRREAHVYGRLRGAFMPEVLAWEDDAQAPILVLEDLSAAQWPPPWSQRSIELVLDRVRAMHGVTAQIGSFEQVHGVARGGWKVVAESPEAFLSLRLADRTWLREALPVLIAAEAQCSSEGASLTHFDLRSDNICVGERGAIFVDWNLACLGNPDLDLGFLLPSLAYEGGPQPEAVLPDSPQVAARVSGFFAVRAGLPSVPDAPRVRAVQRRQLETALPWAARALELAGPAT